MKQLRRPGLGTVLRQKHDQLEIEQDGEQRTLRMVGFPPGFQLQEGERVSLTELPDGPAAEPLVDSFEAELSPDQLKVGEIEIAGRPLIIREETELPDVPEVKQAEGADEPDYIVFVVERDESRCTGPQQVIAIRPADTGAD